MSAEYAAERLQDAINGLDDAESMGFTDEDIRTGGYFFGMHLKGRTYEVLVIEVNRG